MILKLHSLLNTRWRKLWGLYIWQYTLELQLSDRFEIRTRVSTRKSYFFFGSEQNCCCWRLNRIKRTDSRYVFVACVYRFSLVYGCTLSRVFAIHTVQINRAHTLNYSESKRENQKLETSSAATQQRTTLYRKSERMSEPNWIDAELLVL